MSVRERSDSIQGYKITLSTRKHSKTLTGITNPEDILQRGQALKTSNKRRLQSYPKLRGVHSLRNFAPPLTKATRWMNLESYSNFVINSCIFTLQ